MRFLIIRQNYKALYLGRAELVIFDDPNYAIEFEGFKEDQILTIDLFKDTLVHCNKGIEYVRLNYGAQRLGFRFLEANQRKYKILYETSNFKHILDSGKSFFLNHSLITRHNLSITSEDEPEMFIHPIMAVSINPTNEINNLANALKNQGKTLELTI